MKTEQTMHKITTQMVGWQHQTHKQKTYQIEQAPQQHRQLSAVSLGTCWPLSFACISKKKQNESNNETQCHSPQPLPLSNPSPFPTLPLSPTILTWPQQDHRMTMPQWLKRRAIPKFYRLKPPPPAPKLTLKLLCFLCETEHGLPTQS